MKLPQIGREKFKRKKNPRCHRDQDDVVKEGPEEVLTNRAHRCPAQLHGPGNPSKASACKDHISSLNGDVRSCADGHAHVRLSKSGGVVDAVSHHAHSSSLVLK